MYRRTLGLGVCAACAFALYSPSARATRPPDGGRQPAHPTVSQGNHSGSGHHGDAGHHGGWEHGGRSDGATATWGGDNPGATLFVDVFLLPFMVPRALCEPEGVWRNASYAPYPYATSGDASNLRLAPLPIEPDSYSEDEPPPPDLPPPPEAEPPPPPAKKWVAFQALADQSYLLGGSSRTTVGGRLQLPVRLELDTTWSLYVDPLATQTDAAWMGTSHLSYRFAQSESVQFRVGLGARQVSNVHGMQAGFDLQYAFDIFWGKPFLSTVVLNVGNVGDSVVGQARVTFGAVIDRTEIFVGYEHTALSSRDALKQDTLGGPLIGVRVWM